MLPSISSIKRVLYRAGWSKEKAQQRANKQNPQLRDFYQHKLSKFRSFHLVFVDESGCDKRVGYRRVDWSPLGVTPIQLSKFLGANIIKYCQPMHKIVSSYLVFSKVLPMLHSLNHLLNSFSSTVAGGQSLDLLWLWLMHHYIIQSGSRICARTQRLNWYICHPTRRAWIRSRRFLLS